MNMKVAVSFLLLVGYVGVRADITWSGDVVIPENADVTCQDHSGVTSLSVGAGATVRFDTAAAHAFPITGSGTIVKEGTAEWTMVTRIDGFTGDYEIASGVVFSAVTNAFGKQDKARKVSVKKGATLCITAVTGGIPLRQVHIAGDGASGRKGALEAPAASTTGNFLDYLYLDDDATLYTPKGGLFFVQRELNLSGFKLTIAGAGQPTLLGCTISQNGGEIYVKGDENAKPTLYLRSWAHNNPTFNIPSSLSPFVMSGFSTISIWDGVMPIQSSLFVSGTNNVLSHSGNNKSSHGYVTNHANWAGSIRFTNETGMARLEVYNGLDAETHGPCMICVSGPVSGQGTLATRTWQRDARVAILNDANSYTGGTYINNYASGRSTLLGYPGSIPNENYSSVTASYGYVDLAVGDDHARWDLDSALKFAADATFLNSCKPRFSNDFTTNGLAAVRFEVEADSPAGAYLGARDAVKFEGTGNQNPIPFAWNVGTAYMTGPLPILLGETRLSSTVADEATNMAVRLEGADVTLDGDSEIYIGQQGSKQARMTISNSVVRSANFRKGDFSGYQEEGKGFGGINHGSLMAGYRSPGILEILDGAVVTGRIIVCGYEVGGPWFAGGQGAVYQRGGKVAAIGVEQSHYSSGVGMGQAGCGYYEMNGGVLEALGCFSVGGYGYGCFAQYGGTVIARRPIAGMVANNGAEVKTRGIRFASCNGGQTEYYMEGGTFRNLSEEHVWIGGGNDNDITCNFTINGPDAVFDCGAVGVFLGMNAHDGIYIFNFNDGVFACGGMRIYRNDKDGVPITNTTFCINFDGGTFRALDNTWTDPFCFGSSDQSLGPTNVAVYSGGAVIDTDCTNVTFTAPFRGAWGKGIKAINLAQPLKNVAYVGSPRVEITGDGIGASAFAHFDSEKMEIDRVIITSPGCGYTTAEVKLIFDKTVALTLSSETGEVILEDNANTGSFTKTGSGSVRLWATNTWGGATIIKGGVVRAQCDWAVPTNTVLKIGGGSVLNLNNHAAKISSIEYLSGGGSIEGASNAEIPETFSMSIDVSDIISGCPIVLGGDRNLDGRLLTVTGEDFSALDKTKIRYRVITVSGGTASGSPSIESAELPPRWSYVTDRKGVSLSYSRGTVLLFR